jgi:hypothetical protein
MMHLEPWFQTMMPPPSSSLSTFLVICEGLQGSSRRNRKEDVPGGSSVSVALFEMMQFTMPSTAMEPPAAEGGLSLFF